MLFNVTLYQNNPTFDYFHLLQIGSTRLNKGNTAKTQTEKQANLYTGIEVWCQVKPCTLM